MTVVTQTGQMEGPAEARQDKLRAKPFENDHRVNFVKAVLAAVQVDYSLASGDVVNANLSAVSQVL
ncbi:uncharacterized protein CCR75_001179 [Bremia lactucae]|uniref:Uncharacterized protein n=1 Tax=Bremia lactucae TaxID=4779 RepID=A0A976ILX3_BRELC|nr:hypothetical protein CCR75_001179 [Bremia lactucae]